MALERNPPTEYSEFILSHFKNQEFLFPRSIMTSRTNGQVFVGSRDQLVKLFEESDYVDCRINGYPLHHKEDPRKLYPSFIFIDLDLSLCSSCKYPIRKLDYILKETLNNIKEDVNGYPTVLWTGGGYHIYQPVKIVTKENEKQPLETIKEFEDFIPIVRNDLCTEFIRFTSKHFTRGKGDPKHNPSIHSCLIRIPGSINSKYNEKVKIIQKWNGIEADAKSLVIPFLDHLIQLKIENEQSSKKEHNTKFGNPSNSIVWIEQLLETPIADHRYYCLWHILIPYLVNIKKLPKAEVIVQLTKWLDDCNRINKVRWNYSQKIKDQIKYDKGYSPISLENLKKENYELYHLLQ